MPSCFVFGCTSGYHGSKAKLFRAPRNADKSLWAKNIPKRDDCDFDFNKSVVCDKHFEPECIKENKRTIVINGEVVPLPSRQKCTLHDHAVPTIFDNDSLPSYLRQAKCHKRKAPTQRLFQPSSSAKRRKVQSSLMENREETLSPPQDELDFDVLVAELKQNAAFLESNNWYLPSVTNDDGSKKTELSICQITTEDGKPPLLSKYFTVYKDKKIECFVNCHGYRNISEKFGINSVDTSENIIDTIKIVNGIKICGGTEGFETVGSMKGGSNHMGVWFSSNCDVIVDAKAKHCKKCQSFKKVLHQKVARMNGRVTEPAVSSANQQKYIKFLKNCVRQKSAQLARVQYTSARVILGFRSLRQKFEKATEEEPEKAIQDSRIPDTT